MVEDDRSVRDLIEICLGGRGYEVSSAGEASTALSLMRDGYRPDAMLVDHMLPDMYGADLCRVVKDFPGAAIPCLLFSAAAVSLPALAFEAGVEAFLAKPFEIDELIASVEGLLAPAWPAAPLRGEAAAAA